MFETLKYEVKNNIGYITIDRPEAMNAISMTVLRELHSVFEQVNDDPEVKVAILTGNGKAFVAGADISQMSQLTGVEGHDMIKYGAGVMDLIEAIDKPVIAAVNGFALGGGCELAMACDIRRSSPTRPRRKSHCSGRTHPCMRRDRQNYHEQGSYRDKDCEKHHQQGRYAGCSYSCRS